MSDTRPLVVLVDDDLRVVEALVTVLRREPYQVIGLTSPHATLALLEQRAVSVVVSDEKMPQMSGSTLFSHVRARWPHVARVMLTGHADMQIAMHAFDVGDIQRFLLKPCPPPDLMAAIRRGIGAQVASYHRTG